MSKKFTTITIGLMILFSLSLNASYTDEERIEDMQIMEQAMVKIQKGLLVNDKEILYEGVDELQKVTNKVKPPVDHNSILKQKNTYKYKFSKKQGEKIIRDSESIKKDMEAGNKHSASKSFIKVLDECISCHNKIRKWQDK